MKRRTKLLATLIPLGVLTIVGLSFLIMRSCVSCLFGFDREEVKRQILETVENNAEELLLCVGKGDYEEVKRMGLCERIEYKKEGSYEVPVFFCEGVGIVSESSYYGYYYSPLNVPLCVDGPYTSDLTEEGAGWGWKETEGDNQYYTEKIVDCFFYYESHY